MKDWINKILIRLIAWLSRMANVEPEQTEEQKDLLIENAELRMKVRTLEEANFNKETLRTQYAKMLYTAIKGRMDAPTRSKMMKYIKSIDNINRTVIPLVTSSKSQSRYTSKVRLKAIAKWADGEEVDDKTNENILRENLTE